MAFVKRNWIDRETEYPNRRSLAPAEGGNPVSYYVEREEGLIYVEGDAFDAAHMNDLEQRIEAAVSTKAEFGRERTAYTARHIIHMPRSAFANAASPQVHELPAGWGEGDLLVIYDG